MPLEVGKYLEVKEKRKEILKNQAEFFTLIVLHIVYVAISLILGFVFHAFDVVLNLAGFIIFLFFAVLAFVAKKINCRWILLINITALFADFVMRIIKLEFAGALYDFPLLTITFMLFMRIGRYEDKIYDNEVLYGFTKLLNILCTIVSIVCYIAILLIWIYFEWLQIRDNFFNMVNPFAFIASIWLMLKIPFFYVIAYMLASCFLIGRIFDEYWE